MCVGLQHGQVVRSNTRAYTYVHTFTHTLNDIIESTWYKVLGEKEQSVLR